MPCFHQVDLSPDEDLDLFARPSGRARVRPATVAADGATPSGAEMGWHENC
jgi:hypothetical protein